MRITNKMMTNNMMSNINKNKFNMTTLEEQYSSGKKIQRPSDDPIIAVRALKLRTNLSEINQYCDKNIPDAMHWMDVTESALGTTNDILSQINTYCVQGSTGTLTAEDRSYIVENLTQLQEQIYQEGNASYAGRYVFTGYKTDSSLTFMEDTDNLNYEITENFSGDQISNITKVNGSYELEDFDDVAVTFDEAPQEINAYRIQLSYDELEDVTLSGISYSVEQADGTSLAQTPITNIVTVSALDEDAYLPADDEAHFIPETGEIILGQTVYESLRTADNMQITYEKNSFSEGDIKPEHYFDCIVTDTDLPAQPPIEYTKADQEIQYEVSFNQKLTVNTEASDAFSHSIGRDIQEVLNSVNDVVDTEEKIAEVEERLEDTSLSDTDKERYEKMLEQLDTELTLKKEIMKDEFSGCITSTQDEQDKVNTAVADLGSRYVRLELTESRLSSQKVEFEDLMSENEDADIVDTYIRFSAAETIYNASLSSASKIVQNTLLDYIG